MENGNIKNPMNHVNNFFKLSIQLITKIIQILPPQNQPGNEFRTDVTKNKLNFLLTNQTAHIKCLLSPILSKNEYSKLQLIY